MEWPAGRCLLQWALDEAELGGPEGGAILELGAGIGVTAIGLAVARSSSSSGSNGSGSGSKGSSSSSSASSSRRSAVAQVVATDVCASTLSLLRANADAHGLDERALTVAPWDAARGEESVDALPVRLEDVEHIVGADVVYHGFGVNNPSDNAQGSEEDAAAAAGGDGYHCGETIGFPHTLAALLRRKPSLRVSLLTIDRFSGGAVAAVAGAAGVHQPSTTVDPAISRFVRGCEELGMVVKRTPVPPRVISDVAASQSLPARMSWWLCGHFDGMCVLSVSLAPPGEHKYVRVAEGLHEGIQCDRSGSNPILGDRYSIDGADYDLCSAEYDKLSELEKRRFTRVRPTVFYRPRDEPAPPKVPLRPNLPPPPAM
jgi:hypothetical protein